MSNEKSKLAFIDALRGYAVVLVIASHTFPALSQLPWTLKRFTNLGFFGVQLFFVVSCVTLTRSWRQRSLIERPGVRDFMIRRLFRVAPAYYLAAIIYAYFSRDDLPGVTRLVTFLTFTNGWSPGQMPTAGGTWVGVPGGWSIEAEFAFYALFPLMMLVIRGIWSAVAGLVVSLPLAFAANQLARGAYSTSYTATAVEQFLYYWLPSQLPVFLIGLVLFEATGKLTTGSWRHLGASVSRNAGWLLTASVAVFLSLGLLAWPRLPTLSWLLIPSHVVAALAFSGVALALALRPAPLIVNRAIVMLGKCSFSAYLLHFALLAAVTHALPGALLDATGMAAVFIASLLFAAVVLVTGMLAWVTHRWIEEPGIRLGHRISRLLDGRHLAFTLQAKVKTE